MTYLISFLEGIITFISPCLLPMLPIYISYFAGNASEEEGTSARVLKNALGFVLGFTLVFVAMGALAGTLGGLVRRYQTVVNIVTGAVVIFSALIFLVCCDSICFAARAMRWEIARWALDPRCCSVSSFPLAGRPVWAHFSALRC